MGRRRQLTAHQSADQTAAGQRQHQRRNFAAGDGCFPQRGAHQHHEGGCQIQKDPRHRQRALRLALEIDKAQAQYADNAAAHEERQVPHLHTEHAAPCQGEHHRQHRQRAEVADGDALEHAHAQFAERAVE